MKPVILVVDDESDIRNILQIALAAEGYDVFTAETAAQFRALDGEHDPDIYMIDVSLPDGNGFNLLKDLRRITDKGIIMLTGRSGEMDHVLGLEIGADDYITKPFRIRELCSRVNALHRRIARQQPAAKAAGGEATAMQPGGGNDAEPDYAFDGFALRLAARQLRAPDGGEIALTTAEFDLLVALLGRRGQVLTRDQIMNAIKGRDWESYDRAVDGLVSRLRRKLGTPDGGGSFIRTVHGVGYSFVR
ncbi:response regulator transcription factor [Alkalilacustris brevis]|uniref:response regulator transcription factor n=1 Tax=Alkalilacustris brevis TaxID=2026338 RepID=UPI000E0D8C7B|nr:response regulator transcription factor [Alkalilacustris brevis]